MTPWVDTEQVRETLKTGDQTALNASGCRYCISNDGKACVVIRTHVAWHIEGEGWQESNAAPIGNETGRDMLNFFTAPSEKGPGVWFKCFLPLNVQVTELRTEGDCYFLKSEECAYRASFARIPRLMWDLVSGNAQRDGDISSKFKTVWQDA